MTLDDAAAAAVAAACAWRQKRKQNAGIAQEHQPRLLYMVGVGGIGHD